MKSNLIALLKEKKMNFAEKVAGNMEKGLSQVTDKSRPHYELLIFDLVPEIGRVLRDVEGLSKTQVNYFMSIDEDFIPDVLQFYNGGK